MELVLFTCSDCGKRYEAPVSQAGRQFPCTACGWPVFVPGRKVSDPGR